MFALPKFLLHLPGVGQAVSLWAQAEGTSPADWERLRDLEKGAKRARDYEAVSTDPADAYLVENPDAVKMISVTIDPGSRRFSPLTDPELESSVASLSYNFPEAAIWIMQSPSPAEAKERLEKKIKSLKEEAVSLAEILQGPLTEEDYFALYAVAQKNFFSHHDFLVSLRAYPNFGRFKIYLERLRSGHGLVMERDEILFGVLNPDSTFTRLATLHSAKSLSAKGDFYFHPYDILMMWPKSPPIGHTISSSEPLEELHTSEEIHWLLEKEKDYDVLGTFFENLKECKHDNDYLLAYELFKLRIASPQIFKVLKSFPNPLEFFNEWVKMFDLVEDRVDFDLVVDAPGGNLKALWHAAIYKVVDEKIYQTYGKHVPHEVFMLAVSLWGDTIADVSSLVMAAYQLNELMMDTEKGPAVLSNLERAREKLRKRGMALKGLPLLAYALDLDLVEEEKWEEKRGGELLSGRAVKIDFGAFTYCGFSTGATDIEFNPHEVMIVSALVQAGGEDLNDFADLLRVIEIESDPVSGFNRHFRDYEFDIPTQTFSFQKEIQLGFLQKIANQVRIKDPLTLAREILANYKRTIPKKWWRRIAKSFHLEGMDGVERKVSTFIKNEAQGIDFLQTLLLLEDWSEWWIANPLGKTRELLEPYFIPKRWRTKPADKRLRPGVLLSILASVTLYFKYLGNDKKRIVDISRKISKEKEFSAMTPPEVAEAILLLHRFLNEELRETIVERRDRLPTRKQMLKMRFYEEEEAETREYSELFFSPEVRSALEKLKETYGKMKSIAGPTVHVSFVAARQVVDAFNGYVSGICTAAEDYARYCLSDPNFQPIRILVNGEYKGSFMTYSTTLDGKKALIVASLNAQVYFEPVQFMDHILKYLGRFAQSAGYQMILIPKHEGGQSHDPALRREIQLRAQGEIDLGREIYFPKRGRGSDPKKDFYPHSHRQCWVLATFS